MDFELTEEQKALVALVKDFCKREIKPEYFKELMSQEVTLENVRDLQPWDLVKKAHDLGIRQLAVPERYGGTETSWLTKIMVSEALGRYGSLISPHITRNWKWCRDLAAYGSQELQDELFPQFMEDHKFFFASASTEADAGSDAWMPYDGPGNRVKTFAYKDGDEWVINGEKNYCTGAAVANVVAIMAITDKEKPYTESVATFVVPTDTPGFSIPRLNTILGHQGGLNSDVLLEDVRVPEKYLLAGPGGDASEKMQMRRSGKMMDEGTEIGEAWHIYELTKEYTKTRIQGGKPIFEHKNVGPLVIELGMIIEAMRLFLYRCGWEYDKAGEKGPDISSLWFDMEHAWLKMNRMRIIEILTEVFGAMGVMSEYPVERFIRRQVMMQHTGSTMTMNLIKSMPYVEDFIPVGPLR